MLAAGRIPKAIGHIAIIVLCREKSHTQAAQVPHYADYGLAEHTLF
jgi:hypothetical protein